MEHLLVNRKCAVCSRPYKTIKPQEHCSLFCKGETLSKTRPEEYVATKTTFTKIHALNQKTVAPRDWRSALKRKGLTHEALAKASGVSAGTISNLVRNPEKVVRTSTLEKILRVIES